MLKWREPLPGQWGCRAQPCGGADGRGTEIGRTCPLNEAAGGGLRALVLNQRALAGETWYGGR